MAVIDRFIEYKYIYMHLLLFLMWSFYKQDVVGILIFRLIARVVEACSHI
jgi:hypothetical protein